MALLKYFKSSSSLPSAKDTKIGETTTKEADAAISRVLAEKQPQQSSSSPAPDRPKVTGKRKYTSFSAEQKASIGRYAAEHSNAATVQKFKSNFEQDVGKSTVRLFKKRYLEELKRAKNSVPVGDIPVVKEISVKTRGRPLLLGEFDSDVKMYIKALRKAGRWQTTRRDSYRHTYVGSKTAELYVDHVRL